MFIGSTQKENVTTTQSHESRNDITRRRRIGMSNMRFIIDVINWSGDLKGAIMIGGRRCRKGCGGTNGKVPPARRTLERCDVVAPDARGGMLVPPTVGGTIHPTS